MPRRPVEIFDGSSWSKAHDLDGRQNLRSVSCAAICVAVGTDGDAVTFNGHSWGKPVMIDPAGGLSSVSCLTSGACVAVDAEGWATGRSAT